MFLAGEVLRKMIPPGTAIWISFAIREQGCNLRSLDSSLGEGLAHPRILLKVLHLHYIALLLHRSPCDSVATAGDCCEERNPLGRAFAILEVYLSRTGFPSAQLGIANQPKEASLAVGEMQNIGKRNSVCTSIAIRMIIPYAAHRAHLVDDLRVILSPSIRVATPEVFI